MVIHSAQGSIRVNKDALELEVEISSLKTFCQICVLDGLRVHCIVGIYYMRIEGLITLVFCKRSVVKK